jgi:hypothetical protein
MACICVLKPSTYAQNVEHETRRPKHAVAVAYSDQLFTNFVILVSEKAELKKFPFDLWRILNASFFSGCDV